MKFELDPHDSQEYLIFPRREGSRIKTLVNGDQIFSSMLGAIADANAEIVLETYIYWDGAIGKQFATALGDASKRGVCVRVLLDDYGCMDLRMDLVDKLKKSGVEVRYHRPIRWLNLKKSNHRSHRKLMVVDGSVGFIGGVGIADEWKGDARDSSEWRDNHYQVRGIVVHDMHRLFYTHWHWTDPVHPEALNDMEFRRAPGPSSCQIIASDPLHERTPFEKVYGEILQRAERSVKIISPYFVPGDEFLNRLLETLERGVSVEVITAGVHNDQRIVRNASRYDWGSLLDAGAKIYEYNKTLIHVKMILVDKSSLLVGSANFDVRSMRLNEEASLLIEDDELAAEHQKLFDQDRDGSREVDLKSWRSRPWLAKFTDAVSHLFRSLL